MKTNRKNYSKKGRVRNLNYSKLKLNYNYKIYPNSVISRGPDIDELDANATDNEISLGIYDQILNNELTNTEELKEAIQGNYNSNYRPTTSFRAQNQINDQIPPPLNRIFKFKAFNKMQSESFPYLFETDKNLIISAPTSSGKTVLLEIAICRFLTITGNKKDAKAVYIAPIKALCQERINDWSQKFSNLGVTVYEMTGDMEEINWAILSKSKIIIATPEKLDSISRKWKEHKKFLENIELLMVDEVHLLDSQTRGGTLEAVITRIKFMSIRNNIPLRIVAISATIPNIDDI